jgi:hypothetical protein
MKILYISTCEDCPHSINLPIAHYSDNDDYWWGEYKKGNKRGCSKAAKAMSTQEFLGIPSWCPLDDSD